MTELVRRSDVDLRPDPSRVIIRPFMPGQEGHTEGISRAQAVIERIAALSDTDVSLALREVLDSYSDRHADLRSTFREHFGAVAHRFEELDEREPLPAERIELIGAYLTQEYSVESAALFNPSIVAHPDQSECGEGQLRVLLSVRAVGEGHRSSVEFRSGLLGPGDRIEFDDPAPNLVTGSATPIPLTVGFLRAALEQQGDAVAAEGLLSVLPATFTPRQLEAVLASSELDGIRLPAPDGLISRVRRMAAVSYRLRFPADSELSSRVIVPNSSAESQGIEDVRFVRTERDHAPDVYFGTYTAYDGVSVAPHVMQTEDFRTFDMRPMIGPAAQNKGMALFPRRIGGQLCALSRWDRENISFATSGDGIRWGNPRILQTPRRAWDLVQIGPCASPIETPEGWLVLTHGVGPMREYRIGATLLALDDPTTVISVLDRPLLTASEDERDGYVPNVVYTCGALLHGPSLVVPYGCSDSSIRVAFIDMQGLLAEMLRSKAA